MSNNFVILAELHVHLAGSECLHIALLTKHLAQHLVVPDALFQVITGKIQAAAVLIMVVISVGDSAVVVLIEHVQQE